MFVPARSYLGPIDITAAFTAAIDIFELLAGTGKPLVLLGIELGQPTELGDAQEEQIKLTLKRVTGAPTSGSGGGTSTLQVLQPNDTGTGVTLETGNTTQLSGGTSVTMAILPWNVRAGLLYVPVPESRIVLDAGTRLVLSCPAPNDSIGGVHGWASVGELV